MPKAFDRQMLLITVLMVVTGYSWLVKARNDQPCLGFHPSSDYRLFARRRKRRGGWKRAGVSQADTEGVLAVNHSTRQDSIVYLECLLFIDAGFVSGDWGYSGHDRPTWNVGSQTTIAISPASCFDPPEKTKVPAGPGFHAHLVSASGATLSHRFAVAVPRRGSTPCEPEPWAA